MTTYILGVGVGLFLIIALWTIAVVLCLISLRTQKNLGLIVIVVAAVVTLILVLIPRESENPAPPVFKMASVGLIANQMSYLAKMSVIRRGIVPQLMSTSKRGIACSCPLTKSFVINSNDEFEKKVMNSKDPVIVNFHADWCEPCKILTPRLEKLVSPLENVHLAVIDVEKNVELVHTFEVKAVPAVLAVRNGQVEDKFIGLVDGDMIDNLINKLLNAPADSSTEK